MDKNKNRKSGKVKKILRSAANEVKKIKWCSMKEMVKSGVTVIIVGSAAAVLLTLFDITASYLITAAGSASLPSSLKTGIQIALFTVSVILIILCYIKSNKGDDMLKGLSNSGSNLFSVSKKDIGDRFITRVIWTLTAALFLLLMAAPAL